MNEASKSDDEDFKLKEPTNNCKPKETGRGVPLRVCKYCGAIWKSIHYCPAAEKTCIGCGKVGHYATMCRSSNQNDKNSNNSHYDHRNPKKKYQKNRKACRADNRSAGTSDSEFKGPPRTGPWAQGPRTHHNRNQHQQDNRGNDKPWNVTSSGPPGNSNHQLRDNSRPFGDRGSNYGEQGTSTFHGPKPERSRNCGDNTDCDNDDNKSRENPRDQSPGESEGATKFDRSSDRGTNYSENWRDEKYEDVQECGENFDQSSYIGKSHSENWRDEKYEDVQECGENFDQSSYIGKNHSENWRDEKNEDVQERGERSRDKVGAENSSSTEGNADNCQNAGEQSRKDPRYVYRNFAEYRYDRVRKNLRPANFSNENKHRKAPGNRNKTKSDKTFELDRILAQIQYERGNYECALSYYSKLIELCPTDPINFNNRSACYIKLQQFDRGYLDALNVIQRDPSSVTAYTQLITCSMALGTRMSAEIHLHQLSEINPNLDIISTERTRLKQLKRHLQKEAIAITKKDYKMALNSINYCLGISPFCSSFKVKKAEYLALLNRHEEAKKILDEILQQDSINVDAQYILGLRIYYTNLEEAVAYFKKVLQLDPDHTKSHKIVKAIKLYSFLLLIGNAQLKCSNFEGAHVAYVLALSIDPNNPLMKKNLFYNMGQASFNLKNYERAIKEYSQAIDIDSTDVRYLKQRGHCYMEMKEYEEAIADFSRVCNLEPGDECNKLILEAERLLAQVKKDPYKLLGVSMDPSLEEIRQAYRAKAMIHHPDRHVNDTEQQQKKHERIFKDISNAYKELEASCKRKLI
ncbi:dnaJ homolog subfamily C member 7-like isoform X1 [Diachasmimorpha longicaudata]|uniref:dnaJ homolog subfamily C member 7-like isoform X1 n=1 Tax=Diachasmimorpha longicaudata TaxID=58733 RepID=UPI0030B8ACB0